MIWKIAAGIAGGAVALTLATGYLQGVPATASAQQTTPTPAQPAKPARPAKPGTPRGGFGIFGSARLLLKAALSVTGLTAEQLRTELAAGKSLAQIAQEKGKSADDIVKAARTEYETALKQAVTDGRLTQAQADARLAVFDTDAAQVISRTNLQFGPAQRGGKTGPQRGPAGAQRRHRLTHRRWPRDLPAPHHRARTGTANPPAHASDPPA